MYVLHGLQSAYERERERCVCIAWFAECMWERERERERERESSIIWITDYWQLYGIRFFIYYNMQNTRNNFKKEFNMQNNLV